jgi:hypothetical protein
VKRHVAYESLELGLPDTDECPDRFEAKSTLLCPRAKRLIMTVAAAAVQVELGLLRERGRTGGLGDIVWQPHETFLPCMLSLERDFDAVRVRNRFPGEEAQVIASVEA